MKRNTSKPKNSTSQADAKSTVLNLMLNALIFFLAAVIIYLSYSIFIKLNNSEKLKEHVAQSQKPSEIIQVEVLNGCGVEGVADRFTDFLRHNDFDVVNTGNYESFNVYESIVIDRIGNMANAEKTAAMLGIDQKNVIQQLNKDYFLDVSIIIGKDYLKLSPLNSGQ